MDFQEETIFLNKVFDSDAKNYHAWSYRIWLTERFSLWEGEDKYAEQLLDKDVNNNSAWSYRYFLRAKGPESQVGELEDAKAEIAYVFDKRLPQDMSNEAAWVYLRGIYEVAPAKNLNKLNKIKRAPLKDLIDTLRPCVESLSENRFAVMCMVDIYEVEGNTQERVNCLEKLRDQIDKIRRNYWQY